MSAFPSLISELEAALQEGNAEKHGEMLRHVTTLFLEGAPYFKEDHIRLFDYVFACLVEEIETKAKADLSARLILPALNSSRKKRSTFVRTSTR